LISTTNQEIIKRKKNSCERQCECREALLHSGVFGPTDWKAIRMRNATPCTEEAEEQWREESDEDSNSVGPDWAFPESNDQERE
jgi:hypothetical protein